MADAVDGVVPVVLVVDGGGFVPSLEAVDLGGADVGDGAEVGAVEGDVDEVDAAVAASSARLATTGWYRNVGAFPSARVFRSRSETTFISG